MVERLRWHDDQRMTVAIHAFTDGAHDLTVGPIFERTALRQVGREERAYRPTQEIFVAAVEWQAARAAVTGSAATGAPRGNRQLVRACLRSDVGCGPTVGGVQTVGAHQPNKRHYRQ